MKDYASKELCQELYEATGWSDTENIWYEGEGEDYVAEFLNDIPFICPAYTIGYLLDKLPRQLNSINAKQRKGILSISAVWGNQNLWKASYADDDGVVIKRLKLGADSQNHRNFWFLHKDADTPADALAKLALELHKQGLLK